MASQFISDLYLKANVKKTNVIYSSKNKKHIEKPSCISGRLFIVHFILLHSVVFVQLYSTFAFLKEFCFNEKRYAETTSIGLDAR